MMEKRTIMSMVYALALCILLLAGCRTLKTADRSYEAALQEIVERQYSLLKAEYDLPDSLGMLVHVLTSDGEYTAQCGFSGMHYDSDTHFRIASVTKTFTASAIMLLDQQGRLDIDNFVTDLIPGTTIAYLPDDEEYAIPYKDEITIRQLLSHQGGVFDVFNDEIPASSHQPYAGMNYQAYIDEVEGHLNHQYTLDEMASVIAVNQLTYGRPGTVSHYSDSGFMLLAKIIERVSGLSYGQFLEHEFFVPLQLTGTTAVSNFDDQGLEEPYFEGYTRIDGDFFLTVEDNMSSDIGAGNINSTAGDVTRWIRAILSGHGGLSKQQVQRMEEIPLGNQAYALGLTKNDIGYGHGGGHPGYTNNVVYNEEHDIAIIVVSPFIDYGIDDPSRLMRGHEVRETIAKQAFLRYVQLHK